MNKLPVCAGIFAVLLAGGTAQDARAADRGAHTDERGVRAHANAAVAVEPQRHGTIVGFVRDAAGRPLAGAIVRLLREGAAGVADETQSTGDGTFRLRAVPGRYVLQAALAGFDDARFTSVALGASDELVYRFNLQRAGEGRTTSEARTDRDDAKFRVRAARSHRSIFHVDEHREEAVTSDAVAEAADEQILVAGVADDVTDGTTSSAPRSRDLEGVVQTYFAASETGAPNVNLNFAVARKVGERSRITIGGQTGSADATAHLELRARTHIDDRHTLRTRVGLTRSGDALARAIAGRAPFRLNQVSLQAVDEWVARDGIVVVFGFDYARFAGALRGEAISPRFGVQFDLDRRTRLRAAYAPGERRDATAALGRMEFEDGDVVLDDPATYELTAAKTAGGEALVERTRRLEFGVERVIDGASRLEATAFFDTTDDRPVGLMRLTSQGLRGDDSASITEQQGAARGVRVVYARRLSDRASVSAGYSFGRGQSLAPLAGVDPSQLAPQDLFRDSYFQTGAAQLDAEPLRGTQVQAIVRLSSQATVFAVDPFAGQLAVYDPSLSIVIKQELPSFGLPLRLRAIVDARNLLDTSAQSEDAETPLVINSLRRSVRGGISVRF